MAGWCYRYEFKDKYLCFREFLFPNDLQIDLEYWSESGEYTEDELHEVHHVLPLEGVMVLVKLTCSMCSKACK